MVSLIFYIIASIEYELYFKADEEVTILSKSLDKIIDKRDGAEGAKNTSKHEEEKNIIDGSSLDQVQIGMKLVPNMDQSNFLLKRMQLVGGPDSGYNGLESTVQYDMKAIGDAKDYLQFYEWNGAQHMTFPSLNFDANQIPYGDSVEMCMGVQWTPYARRNQYDRYLNVRNLPECDEGKSGRSQIEQEQPTHGINFYIWKQEQNKGDTTCSGGIFLQSNNLCYKYKAMSQVCIMVKMRHDSEMNQYSWIYTGGCFAGGQPVNYEDVAPGEVKNFKDVQFEVRLDQR